MDTQDTISLEGIAIDLDYLARALKLNANLAEHGQSAADLGRAFQELYEDVTAWRKVILAQLGR